jgi:membrane-bound serine protease (ClpP class)
MRSKHHQWFWLIVTLAVGSFFVQAQAAADRELLTVTISDAIGPAVAEHLADSLQQASDVQAAGIIIQLDTPGGNVESMRQIVQAMYACDVPVIVYVSPSGARAASAGVMITMAADIAAMAPGTNIGAASPVGGGGQEINETMAKKVTNDLVAFAKGIARRRGRNVEWIEQAVRESVSVTAGEALEKNIVDVVANDLEDLIKQIDGRELPEKGAIDLAGATIRQVHESTRTKVLKIISDPNIAYILFMIGLAGLYFELSHPGTVFPGVVGAICLILAFFSFHTLPVNATGILLILLAAVLFILEIKVTSYGMLSVAGVISLILGSLMLFKGAGPQFQVAWQVFLPTVILISGFFVGLASLVVRAHVHHPTTGAEGMVGEIGMVKTMGEGDGVGKVQVHGELWQARFVETAAVGDKVSVVSVDGLVLTVAPLASSKG